MAKFDAEFQLQWVKHYGRIKSLGGVRFNDVEPTLDGNFIAAGESGIETPGEPTLPSGWLMKFSQEGDSLWSRYDLAPFPPHYGNDHFFGGVGLLSSGNIIAGGSATEGQKKYCWLVKVTPDGCLDTLSCQPVVSSLAKGDKIELNVFPNPASEFFFVKNNLPSKETLHLTLFDAMGRPALHQKIESGQRESRIDLSAFAPGLYFFKLGSNGKQQFKTGKLLVVKP